MNPVSRTNTLAHAADASVGTARVRADQREFQSILGRAGALVDGAIPDADNARDAAEQFVAQALVQPVLKGLRETNHAAEPFKPNQAEQGFRSMMDAKLAQRLVKSRHWPLVDHIATSLRRGAEGGGTGGAA